MHTLKEIVEIVWGQKQLVTELFIDMSSDNADNYDEENPSAVRNSHRISTSAQILVATHNFFLMFGALIDI